MYMMRKAIAHAQGIFSDLEDGAGVQLFWWSQNHGRLSRNVVAGAEDLSWAILKFAWSKGSAVLWAQVNV